VAQAVERDVRQLSLFEQRPEGPPDVVAFANRRSIRRCEDEQALRIAAGFQFDERSAGELGQVDDSS
jgi:hypothetical protein